MSRLRIALISLLTVFAFGAVAAGAAQAEGPYWIIKCHKVIAANVAESRWEDAACSKLKAGGGFDTRLLAGESRLFKSVGVIAFKLVGATTVECKTVKNYGTLYGGSPGTDTAVILFSECSVAGKTVAECGATGLKPEKGSVAGEIIVAGKTVLVYPKEKAKGTEEALDAFIPEGESANPNLFVEFELKGTNCGILNNTKVKVEAAGTEIPQFNNKKCGVLAQVGKVAAGVFAVTKSGTVFTEGALNFPATPIAEAELEEGTSFKRIKCELKAFGEKVAEVGVAKVETIGPEAFGWEV